MVEAVATKQCIECCSEIPAKARKCVHCSAYQGWRRFSSVSQTTIALLTALIAVGTVFVNSVVDVDRWLGSFSFNLGANATVFTASMNEVHIGLENSSMEPVWIADFSFCNVFSLNESISLISDIESLRYRYASNDEVNRRFAILFRTTEQDGYSVLGPGETTVLRLKSARIMEQPAPEVTRSASTEVQGGCSVLVRSSDGRSGVVLVQLEAHQLAVIAEDLSDASLAEYEKIANGLWKLD